MYSDGRINVFVSSLAGKTDSEISNSKTSSCSRGANVMRHYNNCSQNVSLEKPFL